jgi:hypothetical protein
LAHTDPCTLLDPAIVSRNGLEKGVPDTGLAVRSCLWSTPAVADLQYKISIGIYDNNGLGDFNHVSFDISAYAVGRHQGQLLKTIGDDECTVSIAVTKTSRVDITGNTSKNQTATSCAIMETTARAVEPKLPLGSG